MPYSSVPAIEDAGVSDVKMAHEFGKIAEGSFNKQMKVVIHENVGVKLNGIDI